MAGERSQPGQKQLVLAPVLGRGAGAGCSQESRARQPWAGLPWRAQASHSSRVALAEPAPGPDHRAQSKHGRPAWHCPVAGWASVGQNWVPTQAPRLAQDHPWDASAQTLLPGWSPLGSRLRLDGITEEVTFEWAKLGFPVPTHDGLFLLFCLLPPPQQHFGGGCSF